MARKKTEEEKKKKIKQKSLILKEGRPKLVSQAKFIQEQGVPFIKEEEEAAGFVGEVVSKTPQPTAGEAPAGGGAEEEPTPPSEPQQPAPVAVPAPPTPNQIKGAFQLSDFDRLELARARARREGLDEPFFRGEELVAPETPGEKQFAQEQRRGVVQEQLGTGDTLARLQEQILNQPSLEPGKLGEKTGEIGLSPLVAFGNAYTRALEVVTGRQFTRATTGELAKTGLGRLIGNAVLITGGALAAIVGFPFIAGAVGRTVIGRSIGTRIASMSKATKGILSVGGLAAIGLGGRGVFDINGAEMETHRKILQGMIEDGERLEAVDRNLGETEFSIGLINDMIVEIDVAESALKELGNSNAQYRISEQWRDDMNNVRSARLALSRRIIAIENIAATGQAALRPDQLMWNLDEFE